MENDPFYSAVITNDTLINLYVNNAKSVGVVFDDVDPTTLTASTGRLHLHFKRTNGHAHRNETNLERLVRSLAYLPCYAYKTEKCVRV